MPFIDYTDDDNGVVARLAIELPEDTDQTLNQMKNAIGDIRTELEASNRFMRDFVDYLEKIPEIAQATSAFQQQEIDFLQKKLDLEKQIAAAQGGAGGSSSRRSRGSAVQTDSRGNISVDADSDIDRREEENRRTQSQFGSFSGDFNRQGYLGQEGSLPQQGSLLRNQSFDTKWGDLLAPNPSWGSFRGDLPEDHPFSGNIRPSEDLEMSSRMQSMMDYRQRLGHELQDPSVLFEHLRQRGMVSESVSGGRPSYTVQVGNKRFSADEFLSSPSIQGLALDHIASQSSPGGNENGRNWRQSHQVLGAAANAVRMMGPGTTVAQNAAGISGLLGTAGRALGGLGLSSGMGAGLLFGGGALGVGAGILGLIEEGGEAYQNVKNVGQLHNGGFNQGLGYEMGMRMMALNPFITTEQARQIMMGGLNLGYTGKEFDTVTQFMAANLKDMNLQVADSIKLIQTNVQAGNQSVGGLASQLNLLQTLSGGSAQTNQQAQQKFIQTSQSLVGQGVSGQVSGAVATQLGQWFQQKDSNGNIDPLAQFGGTITNSAINSPQFQQQMIALGLVPSGTLPQEAVQASGNNLPQNIQRVFQFYAQQASAGGAHAPALFQQMMGAAGITMGLTEATQLYGRLMGPGSQLPQDQAQHAISSAESTVANPNVNQQTGGIRGGSLASQTANNIGNFVENMFTFGHGPGGVFTSATSQRMLTDAQDASQGKFSNQQLNQLVQQYGAGDLVVYDPSGNPQKIDYSNKDMMMGIGNGSWKIAFARTDSEKKALEGNQQQWISGAKRLGTAGNEGTLDQWVNNQVQTNQGANGGGLIDLTPEARKLLIFLPNQGNVPNDPGTRSANTGANGSQPNNNPFTPYGGY